jgi:hypothetical protein
LDGARRGQFAVDGNESLLRLRGVAHRRDDDREHQEEEAGRLARQSVGIADEVKVLVQYERGEDERADADEAPVALLGCRGKKIDREHCHQREDQRVDDRLQREWRMNRDLVRNRDGGARDQRGSDDAMHHAPPIAAERLEEQRRGNRHEVFESGAKVIEPARVAVEQRVRAGVERQPHSISDREEAGVDERPARLVRGQRAEEQHADAHRDQHGGNDAGDQVAMKDGDDLVGGVLHRRDDDMTRVM